MKLPSWECQRADVSRYMVSLGHNVPRESQNKYMSSRYVYEKEQQLIDIMQYELLHIMTILLESGEIQDGVKLSDSWLLIVALHWFLISGHNANTWFVKGPHQTPKRSNLSVRQLYPRVHKPPSSLFCSLLVGLHQEVLVCFDRWYMAVIVSDHDFSIYRPCIIDQTRILVGAWHDIHNCWYMYHICAVSLTHAIPHIKAISTRLYLEYAYKPNTPHYPTRRGTEWECGVWRVVVVQLTIHHWFRWVTLPESIIAACADTHDLQGFIVVHVRQLIQSKDRVATLYPIIY